MTYTSKAKALLDGRIPPDATQAEYQWFRSGALIFASWLDEKYTVGVMKWNPGNPHEEKPCEHEWVMNGGGAGNAGSFTWWTCKKCHQGKTEWDKPKPSVCEHRVATMNKIDLIEHIEKCMGYEKPQPSVVGEIEWEKRPYETYEAHLSRIIPRLVEVLNKRTNDR